MMDSAANTRSPTADSSMFTPVLPTASLLMLTLAEQISSPALAALNSRQTIIVPNTEDVRAIFFFTALLGDLGRWNLWERAHWLSRYYVRWLLCGGGRGLRPACA